MMRRFVMAAFGPMALCVALVVAAGGLSPVHAQESPAPQTGPGTRQVAFLERLFGGREVAAPPGDVGAPAGEPLRRRRGAPLPPDAPIYDDEPPRRGLGAIFGRRRQAPPAIDERPAPQQAQQPRKKRPAAAPAEPDYAVAAIEPKAEDARKVLVIGDFVAGALAWGLDQAFAAEPRIRIVDASNGASGFVRSDYYDWNAELPAILDAQKPDMVVVLIGANDRQVIRAGEDRLAPRTPEWQKVYEQRLDSLLLGLQAYGRPFYWIGAPPLGPEDASADMTFLNSLFEARVKAVGGSFIDVWDGFSDEDGKFVARGPDMDGQVKALRTSDGIGFTRPGRRKLAFYVETEIRRDGGVLTPGSSLISAVNPNEVIEIGPDGKERRLGPVVSLTDPPPGAADSPLAGAVPAAPPPADSAQYKLVVEGAPPPPPAGRVDDFTWRPAPKDEGDPANRVRLDGIVLLPAPTAAVAAPAVE
ncbi:SGNH/GDSL hydrolase family protein [Prosthecomicrobium pneumaticum]|uniref:SGNH hydrolase-type esterase domain-containing protein n=1 Tax=Prosthecomicrobium pneumaticum TaxID=81895 RepID=A0A7W9FKH3_9HYPH|nr:SGNH family hydrolase [Prosthecomicrobium pneumaticum]MBB5752530.1 hypothetical protein [Prosthecomicrobium pneumaticum]